MNFYTEIIPFELLRGVQRNCLEPYGTKKTPSLSAVAFLARIRTDSCQAAVSSFVLIVWLENEKIINSLIFNRELF